MRRVALTLALLIVLSAISCTKANHSVESHDGERIALEDLESLFSEMMQSYDDMGNEMVTLPQGEDRYQLVFWTKSENLYHIDPDCSLYSKSSDKLNGTLEKAIKSGKVKPCSICLGMDSSNNSNQNETIEPSKGDNIYDIP